MHPPVSPLTERLGVRTNVQTAARSDSHTSTPSKEMSTVTTTACQTHYINWSIDRNSLDIARLVPKGEKRGVIAVFVENDGIEFKLELCASGWRNSQDEYSAFYLSLKGGDESFLGRYRVTVGDITKTSSIRHDFHLGVGFPNFCSHAALNTVIGDDGLHLQVTVEVFRSRSHIPNVCYPKKLNFLPSLMENIHLHGLHTDVVVVCQGHRIPAHKAFLSSASPVFREMFSQPSREVSLDRFSLQTVRAMIRFLYTAKLDGETQSGNDCFFADDEKKSELMNCGMHDRKSVSTSGSKKESRDQHIFNLFQFAEIYQMTSLVVACCQEMYSTICVDEACELLIRLDRHSHISQIGKIQASAWNFVRKNYAAITNKSSFERLVAQHPDIVAQLMDRLL